MLTALRCRLSRCTFSRSGSKRPTYQRGTRPVSGRALDNGDPDRVLRQPHRSRGTAPGLEAGAVVPLAGVLDEHHRARNGLSHRQRGSRPERLRHWTIAALTSGYHLSSARGWRAGSARSGLTEGVSEHGVAPGWGRLMEGWLWNRRGCGSRAGLARQKIGVLRVARRPVAALGCDNISSLSHFGSGVGQDRRCAGRLVFGGRSDGCQKLAFPGTLFYAIGGGLRKSD